MRTKLAIVATAALALAGCATGPNGMPYHGGPDNFGEANKQTLAAQVIDPLPVYDGSMESSAQHAVAAQERYRTDKVKQPDRVKTSNAEAGGTGR
jgi:hypothetical protein